MGWTSMHREKGIPTKDFLQNEIVGKDTEKFGELLAVAGGGEGVIYGAWKLGSGHGEDAGRVMAIVFLTRWYGGWHNFGYKAVTEDMGPGDYACPARILALLDPPVGEYATQWREGCRQYHEAKAARPKVKPGDVVRFARAITFRSGDSLSELRLVKGSTFAHPEHAGLRYRLTKWRDREYELVQS